MKILIYGLGQERLAVEDALKRDHEIIGYTDDSSEIRFFGDKRFYHLEELKTLFYDYIIITYADYKKAKETEKYLVQVYGICPEKLVNFYSLYYGKIPYQKVDRVMQVGNGKLDGIILGMSHGEMGINPKYLPGNFCNLSVSAQDIYYNLATLRHCIRNYRERIDGLKYVILDMYDYTYFNYDVSQTKRVIPYFSYGGYHEDLHYYKQNKNYQDSVEVEMEKQGMRPMEELTQESIEKADCLFWKDYEKEEKFYSDFPSAESRNHIIDIEDDNYCKETDYMPTFAKKHYAKTMEENICCFNDMLEELYGINPEMKVYVVLIPRYYLIEEIHKSRYEDWKEEFRGIIEESRKKYKFYFLNFKEYLPISQNHNFYFDAAHLNDSGATAFTALLNHTIFEAQGERNSDIFDL